MVRFKLNPMESKKNGILEFELGHQNLLFGKKHVINISRIKMNGLNFEPSQNQMHMLSRVISSFDDFLSHLTIPPVWIKLIYD